MAQQSRNQASKASQYKSKVESLDSLGTNKDAFEYTLTGIEEACAKFIERVKSNMQQEDLINTGKIENMNIVVNDKDNSIVITGNPWVLYQDRGVNGSKVKRYDTPHRYTDKMPPVKVFKEYIRGKNIKLRNNENYGGNPSPFKTLSEEDQINNAAWGMAKNIYMYGFKPRNFFAKEIPELIDDIKKVIIEFTQDQIYLNIDAHNSILNKDNPSLPPPRIE